MRSIMILVDENGYLITNNRLSENIK
jgi:hypothetical protein